MEKPMFAWIAIVVAVLVIIGCAGIAQAEPIHDIETTFERAAWAYRLDEDLLIAIATLESGYGTSLVAINRNNWFGWFRYDGTYMTFDSPQASIWHVARAISSRPHGSIEEIAAWYNAPYADVWTERVRGIYEERKANV